MEDAMTEALVEKTCAPCRGGIPPLTRAEAEELLPQAPEWRSWIMRTGSKRPFVSGTSGRRSHSFKRLASLRRRKVTIPTLASAGAWDCVAAHQEDQGSPRERFHHGGKDRSACTNGRQSCLNKLWGEFIPQWLPILSWGSIP